MKLIASGVTFSAAIVRSPSFSRSSSSTRITIFPRRMSATNSSTLASGALSLRVRATAMLPPYSSYRGADAARPAPAGCRSRKRFTSLAR